jgi:AcrR family transcriptional regulator
MTPKSINDPASRLSQKEWLMRALDILAEEHNARLSIDVLVKRMGVTKGSFYWHFKDRDDFLSQILDYWVYEFNEKVGEEVNRAVGDQGPRERLRFLLTYLVENDCSRYDILIRSWAAQVPRVGEVLKKVDQFRLESIYPLLNEMGLPEAEAKLRSRILVTYMSLRAGLFVKRSKKAELAAIDDQIAFFTRP